MCDLYVRGFDFGTTAEAVKAHCSVVGQVLDIKFIRRGVAIVTYGTEAEAQMAVATLDKTTIMGNTRFLEVAISTGVKSSKKRNIGGEVNSTPLDATKINEISAFLLEQGGQCNMGILGGKLSVNRTQVEGAGFVLTPSPQGHGQYFVTSPGMPVTAVTPAVTPAVTAPAKKAGAAKGNASPQEIIAFLNQKGGEAPMDAVGGHFKVKKDALTQMGFTVELDGNGKLMVKSPGGITSIPSIPAVAATEGAGNKKAKRAKTSGNEVVLPLDASKVTEIMAFLQESGGTAALSVLGSKFQVRKPQLEAAGFVLNALGANGQFQVSNISGF